MHRVVALLALAAAACGRISFDALGDGGSGDGGGSGRSLALPAGGQMKQVVVAATGDWYALSENAGVFRSTDQGSSWSRCAERRFATAIAVTATGEVWTSGLDVVRSTDACATWQATAPTAPSEYVFADGTAVWAATNTGLVTWSGTTWTPITTPIGSAKLWWMGRSGANYFIATANDGVLVSPDASSWTQYATPAAFDSLDVAQVAGGPTHTYAITQGGTHNIACSDGAAATWTSCSTFGGLAITVDPNDDAHALAAIYDDLGETTNAFAGITRNIRELTMDAAIVEDIDFLATGELLAATDRGVFIAPAGTVAFQPRLTGLDAWDIDGIARDGSDVWLWTRGGVLHSVGGAPFEVRTVGISGNTEVRHVRVMPDGRVVAAGRNLYVSDDRGDTWSMLLQTEVTDGFHAADVAFVGSRMFVATGARLQFSDPPYTAWTIGNLPGGPYPATVLFVSAGRIWIGTEQGLRFTDNGTGIFSATDIGTREVRDLLELPDGRLVVATRDGAWISNATKTLFSRAGLDAIYVDGLTLVGDTLFASTDRGVSYTRDAGMTWMTVPGAGLASSATLLDDSTGELIVGTDSRGLIRVPMP